MENTDEVSGWYERTELDPNNNCNYATHCADCRPDGDCDSCDTIDGRWITAVSDYASTCDWCYELTHHNLMEMDPQTQFGYCEDCFENKIPPEIRERIKTSTCVFS